VERDEESRKRDEEQIQANTRAVSSMLDRFDNAA
jgi:hypothetical protein